MSSPFLAAVGGARGITGPAGPTGAPGANGLSLDVFLYKFSAAVTGTPAAGFLRLDSAPATAARLVAATVDASGRDQTVLLQTALGSSKIRIQLRTNIGSYVELSTTGPPVAVVGAIEWPVASAVVGPAGAPLDTNEIYLVDVGAAGNISADVAALQASQAVQDGLIAANTTLVNNLATSQLAVDAAQNTAISTLQTQNAAQDTRIDTNEASINTLSQNVQTTQAAQDASISALQTQNAAQDLALQTLNTSQAAQDTSIGILQAKTARQDVNARWTEPVEPALGNSNSIGTGALPWANVYTFDLTATNLRANTWRNATNTAGVSLTDAPAGSVQLSGTDYTGDADRAITVAASGILQKSGASISAAGVVSGLFRGAEYLDGAGVNGLYVPQGPTAGIQFQNAAYKGLADRVCSHDADGTLKGTTATISAQGVGAFSQVKTGILNAPTQTVGLTIADTTAGSISFTGGDYTGSANNLLNVDAAGVIAKTQATMSQAGALECKSILTQSITGNAAGPDADLEVKNQAGVGIKLVDGAAGAICLTGTNYAGNGPASKAGQFLRIDDSKGTLVAAAVPVGTGDVVGPAAATDERIARWDGATGKLLQDSIVSVTDSGIVTGATGINLASGALVQGAAAVFEAALFRGNSLLSPEQEAHLVNQSNVGVAVRAGADAKVRLTGTEYASKAGQYLRIDDATGTLVAAAAPVGTGDVVGPAAATDNAVARFDTVTGKLLQNSSVTITDAGRLIAPEIDGRLLSVICDGLSMKGDITPELPGDLVSLGAGNLPFQNLFLSGQVRVSSLAPSAGKLFTVNASGDIIPMNLVGPGTLRVDAAGVVSVLLDPVAPPLVTPTNLTSNTSDPSFTLARSSVNAPANEAYTMFDNNTQSTVWYCAPGNYDPFSGSALGPDQYPGIGLGAWFEVTLDAPKTWSSYSLTPLFIGSRVTSWTIHGRDQVTDPWTLITSQSDYTWPTFTSDSLPPTITFPLGSSATYRYLLVHISKILGNYGPSGPTSSGFREVRFQ